jgi:hypothetical protein
MKNNENNNEKTMKKMKNVDLKKKKTRKQWTIMKDMKKQWTIMQNKENNNEK